MGRHKRKRNNVQDTDSRDPLATQMRRADVLLPDGKKKKTKHKGKQAVKSNHIDKKTSRKILKLAREQQQDIEDEELEQTQADSKLVDQLQDISVEIISSSSDNTKINEDEKDKMLVKKILEQPFENVDLEISEGSAVGGDIEELDQEEQNMLNKFLNPFQSRSLADIILDKIREKEQVAEATSTVVREKLNPRVLQVYKRIGKVLARYKSGRIPKAFKVIPILRNWESILYVTNPDKWTPQATFQATKIFASNMNEKLAQRYYNLILLPKVRDDISAHKVLNYHYYQALMKSCFKPAAFFKGIILPLCESTSCTYREALIISSIISKKSLPMLHASACLMKVSMMPYSGSTSIFMKALINKKYALPYLVIDAVVNHFHSFLGEEERLPVLWHQCLLLFCQRYKADLSDEQQRIILQVCRKHSHRVITPEVRRELNSELARRGNESKQLQIMDVNTPMIANKAARKLRRNFLRSKFKNAQ